MGPEATEAIAPPGEERRKRIRAAAVRADSHPTALRAARWLRSRLPGDDRFGDPLSTAGHAPVEVLGREVSALEPPRPSAAHELGLGALQLWQGLSEASGRGRGTEQVTLLFTDLVGFSSWALKAGDANAVELLRAVGAVSESAVARGGGTIVKRLGDGVMAVFGDPAGAVEAAFETRHGLDRIEVAGHRPRMRFGVHSGKPRRLGGDYFGVDVNVAARVMAAARPDQVLVSESACQDLPLDRFSLSRAKRLKAAGAPDDLHVVSVDRSRLSARASSVARSRRPDYREFQCGSRLPGRPQRSDSQGLPSSSHGSRHRSAYPRPSLPRCRPDMRNGRSPPG